MMQLLTRRRFAGSALAAALLIDVAGALAQGDPAFQQFLLALWPRAEAAGVSRATFDAAISGLTPDPSAPSAAAKQAEFDKPLKDYLASAVSKARIARGRAALQKWGGELTRISQRSGVPPEIILAAWGMETDFGAARGGKDIIRTLATLAYQRQDRELFRDEWIAALLILQKDSVPREKLKGSWAGAMGDPQFIPSAYLKYAVSYDGASFADIWDRPQDSLASIANFLRQSGWKPALPWGMEVRLPQSFAFSSLHGGFGAFAAQGVVNADGSPLRAQGDATLFLPSGAAGPAFLLSDNYWVLKAYNNSDSYALSLSLLADRIGGADGLRGRWPMGEVFLSRAEKSTIQRELQKRGFYKGTIDGRFGQASRDAIHAFQLAEKIAPADGFGTPDVLRRLAQQ
ncbi:lytic murein transglycosylase [Methylocella silvestris BL2]|uniref:Lytic murein transglycosylase n=1 Tax=Methylocella silvestris (strain DSM 15510 / CIP 108128 / LMG 27833 / NCIMB 13906 / BL2) TaxID=395965 RepID=B8EIV5_METSB|nr:lytic murein transglycosylase [Methylocella silvestris]ACK52447.1 lytic murein transglycosylase [Methylocella silvestris BL2]